MATSAQTSHAVVDAARRGVLASAGLKPIGPLEENIDARLVLHRHKRVSISVLYVILSGLWQILLVCRRLYTFGVLYTNWFMLHCYQKKCRSANVFDEGEAVRAIPEISSKRKTRGIRTDFGVLFLPESKSRLLALSAEHPYRRRQI